MTRSASILLAVLAAGVALTVRMCSVSQSSSPAPGPAAADVAADVAAADAREAPGSFYDAGPPFDGWCAFSVAMGRRHRPRDLTVLEHDALTYHLCGARASDDCDATAMWKNCGELLRADARRQWRLRRRR